MLKKITLTAAAAITVTMLILCTVFNWDIAGFILMGLSFVWFLLEAAMFIKKSGLYGLAPLAVFAVLVGVWIPIALVGMMLTAYEVWFIIGAIACVVTTAYVWSK